MRNVLFGLVAVAALGLACFAPLSQADAQWGFGGGYYGGHSSHYHGGGHGHHGGHGFHGWGGHYDYHAPSLQWHGNHFDYVPGHYDYHQGSHGPYHW